MLAGKIDVMTWTTCVIYYYPLFIYYYAAFSLFRFMRTFTNQIVVLMVSVAIALSSDPLAARLPSMSWLPGSSSITIIALGIVSALKGIVVALPITLVFEVLPQAGRIADYLRGAQMAEQVTAGTEQRESLLEQLLLLATGYAFFNGRYYEPVIKFFSRHVPRFEDYLHPISYKSVLGLAELSAKSIMFALMIAAPVLLLCWLMDYVGLLGNRMVPRVNLVNELVTFKLIGAMSLLLCLLSVSYSTVGLFLSRALIVYE